MGDHTAGMTLAAAVCAALVARTRTGTGQLVSTSLYRQGAYTVSFDLNTFLLTGHSIAIGQRESMGNPCMNNYAAGDGRRFWIVGPAGRPPLAAAVPRGRAARVARPIRGSPPHASRAANAVELIGELDEIFATKPLDEWAKVFAGEPDFFWSPINSIEDVLADEQFHAAGGVVYVPDGDSTCRWSPRPRTFTARRGRRAPRRRNWASTPTRSSPSSGRATALDSRGVPQLSEELVVIVAAHQVVRNRHADSGRRREGGVGPRGEPLEPGAASAE